MILSFFLIYLMPSRIIHLPIFCLSSYSELDIETSFAQRNWKTFVNKSSIKKWSKLKKKNEWEESQNRSALTRSLFSEIEKSTPWSFIKSLTFRGFCGLKFASNNFKLYTIRRRIPRRFQKCNRKSKNSCIESYAS